MTPLLVVGVVLLVLVAGLSLLQRSRERDFSRTAVPRPAPSAAPPPSDPSDDPDWPFRSDPYWGELTWDHDRAWEADGAPPLGSEHVTVKLYAGREGPGAEHREWYEAARTRGDALVRQAAEMLVKALDARGVDCDTPELSEVHIGVPVPVTGRFEGRLLFDPDHEAIDFIDVRSLDTWHTLEVDLDVVDPADLAEDDQAG